MTTLPTTTTEAPGSTTPGASVVNSFITITNNVVVMLQQLADDIQGEPGTAELITAFAENVAGQAIDLIWRWPA